VIQSFGDDATRDLFNGRRTSRSRRFPQDIRRSADRKFDMLHGARTLDDLRLTPGTRLEALRGDRAGKHGIRVNDQWRLVFRWTETGPADVVLEDYH
jgi:proteic killer suppression protein